MNPLKTYACYNTNENIRLNSSSGGLFSLIAESFDVVYGVAMTEDCYGAEFIRVENDLSRLCGSKYLQAKMGNTFKNVKLDLENGKSVLFSGTGCQVNGLCLFLGKEYTNLFCLDVICHGAPSPRLWKEYVLYQEEKFGKIENVNFRCKDDSWQDFGMKENQMYISKDKDAYMRMFLRDYCLRPSCYSCKAKEKKLSDITIADFWGIENVASEMNDGMGTSLVIVRSQKGQEHFERIKPSLKWKKVSYEDGVRGNPAEYKSANRPELRNSFFKDLDELSFDQMISKYASDIKVPFMRRVVRKMKHIIKKILLGGGHTKVMQKSNSNYGLLFTFKK